MFFAALALTAVFAQLVIAQSQCSRTYTVQAGDICDSISAAQNASTFQVAVVNYGIIDENCDNLAPGQSLCLGWVGQDCTQTYVVKLGDDCDIVSYAFGINDTMLHGNNPQLNDACANMYVGEVLCVAPSIQVPPPPPSGTLPATAIPPTSTPASTDLPWCD